MTADRAPCRYFDTGRIEVGAMRVTAIMRFLFKLRKGPTPQKEFLALTPVSRRAVALLCFMIGHL
jgi:hypothetical protein